MHQPERLDRKKTAVDWETAQQEVMEKVIDIDTPGTAYTHIVNAASLEAILTSGLLGQTRAADRDNKKLIGDRSTWASKLRDSAKARGSYEKAQRALSVYFNIVERSTETDFGFTGRTDTHGRTLRVPRIMNSDWSVRSSSEMVLLFSVDGFTEVQPDGRDDPQDTKTYRANFGGFYHYTGVLPKNERESELRRQALEIPKGSERDQFAERYLGRPLREGLPTASSEWGFKLVPRVPPRNLCGIIIKLDQDYQMDESWDRGEVEPKYQEEMKHRLDKAIAAQKAVFGDHPERAIPIYDFLGNVLWPKEMSWDEVKASAAAS